MGSLLEYVGCVHIFLGPYRGNPIALYLKRTDSGCQIGPKVYPWNDVVGVGDTPNKAAADFEEKWKARGLTPDMYSGPSWEGGIKPERPAPPKPATPPQTNRHAQIRDAGDWIGTERTTSLLTSHPITRSSSRGAGFRQSYLTRSSRSSPTGIDRRRFIGQCPIFRPLRHAR